MGYGNEWREEYGRNRYLRHLPNAALQDRLNALSGNL